MIEQRTRDEVRERHLDLLLDEQLAPRSAPNVTEQVAAALARRARPARRTWVQAACGLLGLGVVLSIALLATDAPRRVAQAPPLGPEVVVDSLAAIERLPADTDNVRLTLHTAEAVRALTRLRRLRRLDASFDNSKSFRPSLTNRPKFLPEAARFLGMLTSLEELDLSCHAPIAGLEQLATLADLRKLRIHHGLIDPQGLTVLNRLPKLEDLVLEATLTLDDDELLIDLRNPELGFVEFASRGQLLRLTLTACITDAAGIRAIAENPLHQLRLYALSRAQRTGRHRDALEAVAYDAVREIGTLRELTLSDIVTPKLLASLADLEQLTTLDLGSAHGLKGTHVGEAIAKIPNLHTFHVEGSDIDTAALLAIAASPTIVEFELGGYDRMTDEVMARVAKMPALRRLIMTMAHDVTDAGMAHLRTSQLESFTMRDTEAITDAGLAGLPKTLRRLHAQGTIIGPKTLAQLDGLTELSAWFYPDTRSELLAALREAPLHRTVRKLALELDLDNHGELLQLAEFPALRQLDLFRCLGEVSDDDLATLRKRGIEVRLPEVRDETPIEVIDTLRVQLPKKGQGGK